MNLADLKIMNKTLMPELAAVFAKYNLKPIKSSSLNDAVAGTVKLTLMLQDTQALGPDGKPTNPYRGDWHNYRGIMLEAYGLEPDWLDRIMVAGGKTYTIEGLKIGRGEPKVVGSFGGKNYLFPAELVALRMRHTAPARA